MLQNIKFLWIPYLQANIYKLLDLPICTVFLVDISQEQWISFKKKIFMHASRLPFFEKSDLLQRKTSQTCLHFKNLLNKMTETWIILIKNFFFVSGSTLVILIFHFFLVILNWICTILERKCSMETLKLNKITKLVFFANVFKGWSEKPQYQGSHPENITKKNSICRLALTDLWLLSTQILHINTQINQHLPNPQKTEVESKDIICNNENRNDTLDQKCSENRKRHLFFLFPFDKSNTNSM